MPHDWYIPHCFVFFNLRHGFPQCCSFCSTRSSSSPPPNICSVCEISVPIHSYIFQVSQKKELVVWFLNEARRKSHTCTQVLHCFSTPSASILLFYQELAPDKLLKHKGFEGVVGLWNYSLKGCGQCWKWPSLLTWKATRKVLPTSNGASHFPSVSENLS